LSNILEERRGEERREKGFYFATIEAFILICNQFVLIGDKILHSVRLDLDLDLT
jgi:hypothetical protein